jgi:DNA-binding protein YbaB
MTDSAARLADLRARLHDLPREQAAAAEAVRRLAEATVTGRSSDQRVTVSANGHGTVIGIEISADTLRRLDSHTLGERLTEAINRSLDAAERLQTDLRPKTEGFEAVLDEAMSMFDHRMDGILSRLDEIADGLGDGR